MEKEEGNKIFYFWEDLIQYFTINLSAHKEKLYLAFICKVLIYPGHLQQMQLVQSFSFLTQKILALEN